MRPHVMDCLPQPHAKVLRADLRPTHRKTHPMSMPVEAGLSDRIFAIARSVLCNAATSSPFFHSSRSAICTACSRTRGDRSPSNAKQVWVSSPPSDSEVQAIWAFTVSFLKYTRSLPAIFWSFQIIDICALSRSQPFCDSNVMRTRLSRFVGVLTCGADRSVRLTVGARHPPDAALVVAVAVVRQQARPCRSAAATAGARSCSDTCPRPTARRRDRCASSRDGTSDLRSRRSRALPSPGRAVRGEADAVVLQRRVLHQIVKRLAGEGVHFAVARRAARRDRSSAHAQVKWPASSKLW